MEWKRFFQKNPSNRLSPNTQTIFCFCRPFVKWNHKQLKIYCCENASGVQQYGSWVLSIISSIKKLKMWQEICVDKPVDTRATGISNLLRLDIMLNLNFRRQLKLQFQHPTNQKGKKKKHCRKKTMFKRAFFFSTPRKIKASMTITDENKMNVIGIVIFSPLRYKIYIEI